MELPLGPFCVQCIKEIGRHSTSARVDSARSWEHRFGYIASRLDGDERQRNRNEIEKKLQSLTVNLNIEARRRRSLNSAIEMQEHTGSQQTLEQAISRCTEWLRRPPKKEDQCKWIRKFTSLANIISRREEIDDLHSMIQR